MMKSTQLEMSSRSEKYRWYIFLLNIDPNWFFFKNIYRVHTITSKTAGFHTFSESAETLSNGPKVFITWNGWVLQNLLFHINNHVFHLQQHTQEKTQDKQQTLHIMTKINSYPLFSHLNQKNQNCELCLLGDESLQMRATSVLYLPFILYTLMFITYLIWKFAQRY